MHPVTGRALALVILAAMLHAVWNALAKRARDQLVFLWSSVSLASVVLVPVGLLGLPEGGVPAAAVPYVVATIVIHAGYFVTLGRAYRHGDFSRVYPIARGLGVAVVRDRPALAREWRENWRTIAVASSMNLTSYLLVLFAFRLSKVGYVVAGRELSILFSTLIGSLWLGEGRLLPRLAGASIVLAGVVCVALAR